MSKALQINSRFAFYNRFIEVSTHKRHNKFCKGINILKLNSANICFHRKIIIYHSFKIVILSYRFCQGYRKYFFTFHCFVLMFDYLWALDKLQFVYKQIYFDSMEIRVSPSNLALQASLPSNKQRSIVQFVLICSPTLV